MTKPAVLLVLCSAVYLAGCITVGQPPVQRLPMRQVMQPMRAVRLHRSGPVYRNVRVRNVPVKRIYVPMKVGPQVPPPNGYKLGPPGPQIWRPKDFQGFRQPQAVRPHFPYNLNPMGPPRKARHPKPKYPFKPAKQPKKQIAPQYQQQLVQHQQQQLVQQQQQPSTDTYKPQNTYSSSTGLVTDSYGAPKPANYKAPTAATTYGKPHPLLGSPEPPKKQSASNIQFKDEPATSYVNVYQGDSIKDEGTYGFSQSHGQAFEKKFKGTVYSDSDSLVSNHRPVYKPKSDTAGENDSLQGSFQPPKQTFGFQPYEDAKADGSYGASQPGQQYYKKQPDNVLGPNYFEQGKSSA